MIFMCCPILYSCCITKRFKENKGIPYDCFSDFLEAWCCLACTICRQYNEVTMGA